MTWIRRGAAVGAGFGLAAAAIDLWVWFLNVLAQRMGPPGAVTLAQNALLLIALGTGLGLLNSIALRSQRREAAFLHLAGVFIAWFLVERWIWVDSPLYAFVSFARPVGAGAFVLAVLLLEHSARRIAVRLWALAALGAVAGIFGPGMFLAATAPPLPLRAALPPARAGAPDVVLVVLDTVRADRMTSYGHTRATSPTFDALAREGAWFADATSPATWSLPAHASLFTGRYPTSHGATWARSVLDDRYPTLAEVLAARGYETFCFTANPWISDGLGLTRGFAVQNLSWKTNRGSSFAGRLIDRLGLGPADKGGALVADAFASWRRARPADTRPAFAFLNFLEAHVPYHQLPREYAGRFTDLPPAELRQISLDVLGQQSGGPKVDLNAVTTPVRALYDGGVAYTDELLRRIVDALRESGALDRTILVVLADHGEVLGERAGFFGHGPSLYQSLIHVPLLVRFPQRVAPGTRVAAPVSTLGVFATILDLAEIEPPPTLQVGSLVSTDAAGEAVLSEVVAAGPEDPNDDATDPQMLSGQHLRAYRSGNWKLVETNRGGPFLFDLARDPTEARNLAGERPEEVKRLAAEIETARARLELPKLSELGMRGARAPAPDLDAATQQRLRELGYLK